MYFSLFSRVCWLVTRDIIHYIRDFSLICYNYLFKIKGMLFLLCVLLVYFYAYFVTTEVVSSHSRIVCVSNLLELIICGVGGNFFAMRLLISIDRSFLSILAVLLKEQYVCSMIKVPF